MFFEKISEEQISQESVSKETYEATSTGIGNAYAPSQKVENLKIIWNKSKTTMKVKDLPIGSGNYDKGVVYIENGFLKVKE